MAPTFCVRGELLLRIIFILDDTFVANTHLKAYEATQQEMSDLTLHC